MINKPVGSMTNKELAEAYKGHLTEKEEYLVKVEIVLRWLAAVEGGELPEFNTENRTYIRG